MSAVDAVVAKGLVKAFGRTVAADGIDLVVPAGSFFGLVGRNGAGKSTLIKMCTGLLRPDAGAVTVAGRSVWPDPVHAKAVMGVLPEDPSSFDRLTCVELLECHGLLRRMDMATVGTRARELLTVLELREAAHVAALDLSTGMRKKLALACALLHAPRVLFLDEPFESVDPVSARTIRAVLEQVVAGGGTVILSSHVMETVQRLCSHLALVHRGRVVVEGTTAQVRGERTLEEIFVEIAGEGQTGVTAGLTWLASSSG